MRKFYRMSRREIAVAAVVLAITTLLFTPMMHHWRLMGDYTVHNNLAFSLTETPGEFFRNTPHFLYHILTAAMYLLVPGGDIYVAGVRVMILSYLALALLIFWLSRWISRQPDTWAALAITGLLTLCLMLIAPINLLTPDNLYLGYFAPHVYHNPTINLLKPFAIGLFFAGLFLYREQDKLVWRWFTAYALLTALCLIAKPSFILTYVPTLGFITLYYIVRHLVTGAARAEQGSFWERYIGAMPVNWPVLMGGIVFPAFAILIYQSLTWTSSGGITIEPFRVFFEWTLHYEPNADKQILLKFVMSAAFPIVVYALYIRDTHRSLMLNTAWLNFLISAVYAYLLVDNTVIAAGDFGWSAEIGMLVLHIASAFFLLARYRPLLEGQSITFLEKIALGICVVVFTLHVISGLNWYYLHLTGEAIDLLYGVW